MFKMYTMISFNMSAKASAESRQWTASLLTVVCSCTFSVSLPSPHPQTYTVFSITIHCFACLDFRCVGSHSIYTFSVSHHSAYYFEIDPCCCVNQYSIPFYYWVVASFLSPALFVTPWMVACQAPLSVGFSRQECWSGLPFPAPGDLPDPGTLGSPALAGGFFTTEPPVVQSLSHVRLSATPWTAARQASLFFTISPSLLRFTTTESVILSNHLILCCPLLLLPSVFPSLRVFSNELALHIGWPEYWSFSFSISPSSEFSGSHQESPFLLSSAQYGLLWWLSWWWIPCHVGDLDSIRALGRSPGEGKGYAFQFHGLHSPQGHKESDDN